MAEAFSNALDQVVSFFNQIFYAIASIRFFDVVDILIVAFIIYKAIEFLRETRAGQLVKGIAVFLAVWALAVVFNLVSLKWILNKMVGYALITIVVIFQPELRRLLERMGRSNLGGIARGPLGDSSSEKIADCIDAVCKAVVVMADKHIGALIVFERKTMLGEIVNTGTVLDAVPSSEMVGNIFFPKSPLHDGALVIRDGSLYAAGCILPLTANNDLSSQLGTRHRAAIGMSENSDAVVLVVSEETGGISIAMNGTIKRDYNSVTLREELNRQLFDAEDDKKRGSFSDFWQKLKAKR